MKVVKVLLALCILLFFLCSPPQLGIAINDAVAVSKRQSAPQPLLQELEVHTSTVKHIQASAKTPEANKTLTRKQRRQLKRIEKFMARLPKLQKRLEKKVEEEEGNDTSRGLMIAGGICLGIGLLLTFSGINNNDSSADGIVNGCFSFIIGLAVALVGFIILMVGLVLSM
jgi:hypothetical protein